MSQEFKHQMYGGILILCLAMIAFAPILAGTIKKGTTHANGDTLDTLTLELGEYHKYTVATYPRYAYYSGMKYETERRYGIITIEIGRFNARSTIEIIVREGLTVHLDQPYKVIAISESRIILEAN